MCFSVEFDGMLIFQWFEGIFGIRVVIFDGVKSGENGVKWTFCRSGYRTQNGDLGVGTSDMPFPATEHLF